MQVCGYKHSKQLDLTLTHSHASIIKDRYYYFYREEDIVHIFRFCVLASKILYMSQRTLI